MSNIAEGFERGGDKEFRQFLSLAKGSAGELRSQLYVAVDVGLLSQDQFAELYSLANDTARMVAGFMRYLEGSELKGAKYR
jgi:four helix bundle protein